MITFQFVIKISSRYNFSLGMYTPFPPFSPRFAEEFESWREITLYLSIGQKLVTEEWHVIAPYRYATVCM